MDIQAKIDELTQSRNDQIEAALTHLRQFVELPQVAEILPRMIDPVELTASRMKGELSPEMMDLIISNGVVALLFVQSMVKANAAIAMLREELEKQL